MRKFKSWPYWIHLIIDTVIGQAIWWMLSMIIHTPVLIQSIIAGVVLIATIFAVAWYLPKLSGSGKVSVKDTSMVIDTLTSQERTLLDLYKRRINYDRAHLRELLVVRNERLLLWKLDPVMGGELQFEFDVFNGSVLPVKVGYSVEGNLMVQSRPFHDIAEPQKSLSLEHGIWDTIAIKQRMLPEVVKEIKDDASQSSGIILRFDFHNVHIHIEEDSITKDVGLQNNLKIVETMEFRVKHEAGIYSWQRLWEVSIS
jgi:hypothetical protein